jgi:acetoacetyl-CoA synthetase
LGPESYRYVYSHAKKDIMLAVQSTQPDIMATFAAASPIAPVLEGEIQCVALGMKVEINNEDERPVFDRCGEIVCTEPFPSMPIGFWGDANDPQFRSLYFGGHSRRWHQGQLATLTLRGSMILHEQAR